MGLEIERRFFVKDKSVLDNLDLEKLHIFQYYVCNDPDKVIRIRISATQDGVKAYLTIKTKTDAAIARNEYEYEIPWQDGVDIVTKLGIEDSVEKVRYLVPVGELVWEVDVFLAKNAGLVIAEVELDDISQTIEIPEWIDAENEITKGNPVACRMLSNAALAQRPISSWSESTREMICPVSAFMPTTNETTKQERE